MSRNQPNPLPERDADRAALGKLAIITVTYHPDLAVLARQIRQLPEEALLIVVDNASNRDAQDAIRSLLASKDRAELLAMSENIGLAAAANRGVAAASAGGAKWALLLDQDSEPDPGAVATLLQAWIALSARNEPIGAVGPRLYDPCSGAEHGFHILRNGFWRREFPADDAAPLRLNSLNGSGTLVAIDDFETLGGLDESLFIDHVDTEWSFRMQAAGFSLYGIPQARFQHRMGESTRRVWLLGWRAWPQRSPERHYYLFRNAVRLMRRDYVPPAWKGWACVKLALTALIQGVTDQSRRKQWRLMMRGMREGMAGTENNRQNSPRLQGKQK